MAGEVGIMDNCDMCGSKIVDGNGRNKKHNAA